MPWLIWISFKCQGGIELFLSAVGLASAFSCCLQKIMCKKYLHFHCSYVEEKYSHPFVKYLPACSPKQNSFNATSDLST